MCEAEGPRTPLRTWVAFGVMVLLGAALGAALELTRQLGAPPPPARPQAQGWPDPDPLRGGPIP